ncbi:unnamed protein product, partial [Prorocentrum cordatum]
PPPARWRSSSPGARRSGPPAPPRWPRTPATCLGTTRCRSTGRCRSVAARTLVVSGTRGPGATRPCCGDSWTRSRCTRAAPAAAPARRPRGGRTRPQSSRRVSFTTRARRQRAALRAVVPRGAPVPEQLLGCGAAEG